MADYGKLAGGVAGNALGAAIVEMANQYLPQALPPSMTIVTMAASSILLTYLTKHDWLSTGDKSDSP